MSSVTDSKRKWQIAKQLLHSDSHKTTIPDTDTACDMFCNFFQSKISSLKRSVATVASKLGPSPLPDPPYIGPPLDIIPPVEPNAVLKIINSIKPKTSAADFVPTCP